MELCVLSVVIEFSLLPICEFCIQDAPLGGWFIVTPNVANFTDRAEACKQSEWKTKYREKI